MGCKSQPTAQSSEKEGQQILLKQNDAVPKAEDGRKKAKMAVLGEAPRRSKSRERKGETITTFARGSKTNQSVTWNLQFSDEKLPTPDLNVAIST